MILTKNLDELRSSTWAAELAEINDPKLVEDIIFAVATKPVSVEITRDLYEGEYKWSVEPSIFESEGLPLAIYLLRDTLEECEAFCKEMDWSVCDVTDHTITMEMKIKIESRAMNYWLHKMRLASDTSQVPSIFHGSGRMSEGARQRVMTFINNPCEGTWAYMASVKLIAGHVSGTDVMLGTKEKPIFHGKHHDLVEIPTADEFIERLKKTRLNYIEMCKREADRHKRKHDWLCKMEAKKPSGSVALRNQNPEVIEFPKKK